MAITAPLSATHTKLSTKEIVQQAQRLYRDRLADEVETEKNRGKFITIEVLTGDFEIGTNYIETVLTLKRRHDDTVTCTLRIGYPATYSHGVRMNPLHNERSK